MLITTLGWAPGEIARQPRTCRFDPYQGAGLLGRNGSGEMSTVQDELIYADAVIESGDLV